VRDEISIYEWASAAIGLLLVLTSVGIMVYESLAGPKGPPDVHVQVASVERSGDGYLLSFRADNLGGSTAAKLEIEGRLSDRGQVLETRKAIIDYLPPQSHRSGGMFFTHDPQQATVELQAGGYTEP
jgi:uncharacterized protein (TIGR02588 family)